MRNSTSGNVCDVQMRMIVVEICGTGDKLYEALIDVQYYCSIMVFVTGKESFFFKDTIAASNHAFSVGMSCRKMKALT